MVKTPVCKSVTSLSYTYVMNFDILVGKLAGSSATHGRFNLMRWEMIGKTNSILIFYNVDLVFVNYSIARNPDLELSGSMYLLIEGKGNQIKKTAQTTLGNMVTSKTGSINEILFVDNALYSTQQTEELDLTHLSSSQPFILKVIESLPH